MKEALTIRKAVKARKPRFLKQDAHKVKRLSQNWRAPRGTHSRMRRKFKSYRLQPSVGFSSPRAVRGLSTEGFVQTIVANIADLDNVKDACIIAGNVGMKKRVAILQKAQEKKITILNIKDPAAMIKQAEETLKKRKETTKSRQTKKAKKQEELEKKAKKKEEDAKKETADDKKEDVEKQAKEEKRKVLEQQ